MKSDEIIAVELRYSGWTRFHLATVRRKDGATMVREIEDHGNAAAVLPFNAGSRKALLVGQYRAAVAFAHGPGEMLEAPAGLIDEAEAPDACARREALEETGLALRDLVPVGRFWASPGISTELIHLFLAEYDEADRVGQGGGVAGENEDVRVAEISLAELAALMERGGVTDLKTLALIQALRLRRPELFV